MTNNYIKIIFRKAPKRKFGRLHVGALEDGHKPKAYYWSLDPPGGSYSNVTFADKCLLICTIFSLAQNEYFKSERSQKKFLYLENCHSKFENKKKHALNILANELQILFSVTGLKQSGPYNLQATVKILQKCYKCQFFIFTGYSGKRNLNYMYPSVYDDTLIPIYLFSSFADLSHVIFIKNINSYFRANFRICFVCKKHFSKIDYRHLCPKRQSCFACRRFLQTNDTYVHEKLVNNFCNQLITNESIFQCEICNCTIFSKQCLKGHRVLCNGKGHFGYKCNACSKFTYAQSDTSFDLKKSHMCNHHQRCRLCFDVKKENHFCRLKKVLFPKHFNRLIFFVLEIEENYDNESNPMLAIFNIESSIRGVFEKSMISQDSVIFDQKPERFSFQYFKTNIPKDNLKFGDSGPKKINQMFKKNIEKLKQSNNFEEKLINFFLSFQNTTFVCQDIDGKIMVSLDV